MKPTAQDRVVKNVLDYIPAAHYIDGVLGFRQRNAHDKYTEGAPYKDYWHYVMDRVGINHNDAYGLFPVSFVEIYEETLGKFGSEDWRTVCAKAWADEYPDPEYTLWFSW